MNARLQTGLVAGIALAGIGCDAVVNFSDEPPPKRYDISASASGFSPDSLVLYFGDTLRFEFGPVAHGVTWAPEAGGTVPLPIPATSDTKRLLVIHRVGKFRFHCPLHEGEAGVVEVTGRRL